MITIYHHLPNHNICDSAFRYIYDLFVLAVESLALANTVLHHADKVSVSYIGYWLGKVSLLLCMHNIVSYSYYI